jgi:hypothetical protein
MQIRHKTKLLLDCDQYLSVDAAQGKVTLELPDAVTSALDFDTADLDIKLAGPQPRRLIKGLVTLDPAQTR